MNEIPRISFASKKRLGFDFEIMSLRSLFARTDTLDQAIDHPHRVEFYHILVITKGSGKHVIDFVPYNYQEGSILFVSQGQVQSFDVTSNAEGYLILFTETFLEKNLIHSELLSYYRLYNYHLHSPIMYVGEDQSFVIIVEEMFNEFMSSENFAKEEMLRLLLKTLLLKAERHKMTRISHENNSDWLKTFSVFRVLIEKQFVSTRNVKDYAEIMNISYKHLNAICKSVSGVTAKKCVDNYVILEIKRQLAMSSLSVLELSYDLGFDEPTNLVKYFKKHTQQTPSQFRKRLAT